MKKSIKLAVLSLVCTGAVAQALAQEVITYTDRASTLNIALSGYVQTSESDTSMDVAKIRITTKDILNFADAGKGARLLVVTPVDYDGNTRVVARRVVNKQNEEVELTGYFVAETYALVEQSTVRNDKVSGKQYSIDRFAMAGSEDDPTPFSFDVQGFTTANLSNGSFSSTVNGVAWTPAGDGVVNGKISASGGKEETWTAVVEE